MQKIEQTLDSREVAEMIEKEHKYLIRDIKKYTEILTGAKISPVEFWNESTYVDAKGEQRLCYKITLKGCEFIGHKVRGEKGVLFTARYINRFHEMENKLSEIAKPEISTEQMEKFLNFMEKQQQFMEDQEKFNQRVIKKLESSKRIQAHQGESSEYMTAAYKEQIIVLLDMADNGDSLFFKQIYTIIKARARRLDKIGRYIN